MVEAQVMQIDFGGLDEIERRFLYGEPGGVAPVGLLLVLEVAHAQVGGYEFMQHTLLHDHIQHALGTN